MRRTNPSFSKDQDKIIDQFNASLQHDHCRIKSKNFGILPEYTLPLSRIQTFKLLKKVMAKYHDAKITPENSLYCMINIDAIEYPIVVVPRPCEDPSSYGETNSFQQFLHTHSVFLLDYNTVLGAGGQGKVILAYNLATGKTAAGKICDTSESFAKKQVQTERRNLHLLGQLIGSCDLHDKSQEKHSSHQEITLLTYHPGTNLIKYLYQQDHSKDREDVNYITHKNEINILTKVELILQIIQQVSLLHKNNLIHRDIKTENFIINHNENRDIVLKLIDMGEAILTSEVFSDYASTFGYAPPEVWQLHPDKKPYSKQSDYFSLGIVIAEILSNQNYQAELRKIRRRQSESGHASELDAHAIQTLLADIFLDQPVADQNQPWPSVNYDFNELANYFDNVIYRKILKHKMHALLLSLTKVNPAQRLPGLDLDAAYEELRSTYDFCLEVSKSMHVMAHEIIYVYDALDSKGINPDKPSIYKLFSACLNNLIREPKEKELSRPILMAKAADQCITLFTQQARRIPVNDQIIPEIKLHL